MPRAHNRIIWLCLPGARLWLSCGWSEQHQDDETWYLLSDLPASRNILGRYVGRFSIEEMFRDFKELGFRLEKTRLKDSARVARLVLCVCIGYVFALFLGDTIEQHGRRRFVERSVKRQTSLFQIGLRYLKRLLAHGQDWTELLVLRI
jgi:hypothetical protein